MGMRWDGHRFDKRDGSRDGRLVGWDAGIRENV